MKEGPYVIQTLRQKPYVYAALGVPSCEALGDNPELF